MKIYEYNLLNNEKGIRKIMKKCEDLLKNSKEFSIHGLDIGNSTLVNNKGLILDAKITTIEPIKSSNKITIDGKTGWLGHGYHDTTFIKKDKEQYINMLYGLLALSTKTVHNYLGIGLPLTQWKTDRDILKDIILMNNKKIISVNDEVERVIVIDDVEVFPEGIITLKDEEEGIIIDLGGGTTDCGMVVNEHGKRKVVNPITIPRGTIKLFDEFANDLVLKGLNADIEDAERILTRGYLYKENDLKFDAYEEFVETLINKLQLNYNLKLYPISITGGGGELLYNALKKRLTDSTLTLQKDAITANARNFYELALIVFGEE